MKVRLGFVSNSSSSSFVVNKRFLTPLQIEQIQNHRELGIQLGIMYSQTDYWVIDENEFEIEGHTDMDNFDMNEFMEKIGVDMSKVHIGGD